MTDHEQLVKALRHCTDNEPSNGDCWNCPYQGEKCHTLLSDAAAAIEALQAQLPKRGEWITIRLNNGGSYTGCSCCEAPIPTDTMLDYIPESESKYCYSCGAKMEVQG